MGLKKTSTEVATIATGQRRDVDEIEGPGIGGSPKIEQIEPRKTDVFSNKKMTSILEKSNCCWY